MKEKKRKVKNRIYEFLQIQDLIEKYNKEPTEKIKQIQSRFSYQDKDKSFKEFSINSKGSDFY